MMAYGLIKSLHRRFVFGRRAHAIAEAIAPAVREGERILDVGCGTGELAALLQDRIEGVQITGVETQLRGCASILVQQYNGRMLPFADNAFDVTVIADVLHHADDAAAVLREANRVSRRLVIVKDHIRTGLLSQAVLSFMDWVGNAPHNVACPYRYLSRPQWETLFRSADLELVSETRNLGLYPWPASALFERDYHMVAVLTGVGRAVRKAEQPTSLYRPCEKPAVIGGA
jgi:SAM-dependent methyltransferase